jgi:hypothetical protein
MRADLAGRDDADGSGAAQDTRERDARSRIGNKVNTLHKWGYFKAGSDDMPPALSSHD